PNTVNERSSAKYNYQARIFWPSAFMYARYKFLATVSITNAVYVIINKIFQYF
ncbi:10582_t:CDS:1, partial [Rhizophagus irregularis]